MIVQKPAKQPNDAQKLQIQRKYGMFMHFGINTFANLEWSDGTLSPSIYTPTRIDAEQWVKTAKDAGMSYVILVSKHHDGFCLFDTKYTDYCVNSAPNKTDVVKEVSQACRKYGIKLGLYYSLWDRHEQCYSRDLFYVQFMKNQITELMDGRYGEIVELWLDGGWEKSSSQWHLDEIYDLVKTLQPNCVVGVNHTIGIYDSVGMAEKKYYPLNYQENYPMKFFPSDFRLCDPLITKSGADDPKIYSHKGEQYYLPFEGTICINTKRKWFWSEAYPSYENRTPEELARQYRHFTEQDNMFVVNCAPNKEGRIEEKDRNTLMRAAEILEL